METINLEKTISREWVEVTELTSVVGGSYSFSEPDGLQIYIGRTAPTSSAIRGHRIGKDIMNMSQKENGDKIFLKSGIIDKKITIVATY